jgi:hypothetical protein
MIDDSQPGYGECAPEEPEANGDDFWSATTLTCTVDCFPLFALLAVFDFIKLAF